MDEEIDHNRRRFLGAAAMTIATAELVMARSALAQSDNTALAAQATSKAGVNNSFSTLSRIKAGVLNVGYAEVGPADGARVVLLHGWPMTFIALSMLRLYSLRPAAG
jgi:hypothetical protein